MGAGSYPPNAAGAGADPLIRGPLYAPNLPVAAEYNPSIRQFVLLESGDIAPMHPVDQAVLMAVTIEKGKLSSSPDTGIVLDDIREATSDRLQATITDAVTTALASLIDDGSIRFIGAPILRSSDQGLVLFAVDYVNLKAPGTPERRIRTHG